MRQHAETPLEVWSAPGLVHFFRVMQEVGFGGDRDGVGWAGLYKPIVDPE